jgi:LemA protein
MLSTSLILVLILIGVPLLLIVGLYNSLIMKKNQVNNAFAGMDAMLKKRFDLIPNLVSSVQQYMTHEKGVLTELTALRTKALSGGLSEEEKVDVNNKLTKAIGGIMVAVENYPALKASDNFLQLQRALNEIEEQLSAARRSFNASVTDLNNAIEVFPSNLLASAMGFSKRQLFEIPETERKNVDVNALFKR